MGGTTASDIATLAKGRWDGRLNHRGDTDGDESGTATAMAEWIRDLRHGQDYDAAILWDLETAVKAARRFISGQLNQKMRMTRNMNMRIPSAAEKKALIAFVKGMTAAKAKGRSRQ